MKLVQEIAAFVIAAPRCGALIVRPRGPDALHRVVARGAWLPAPSDRRAQIEVARFEVDRGCLEPRVPK